MSWLLDPFSAAFVLRALVGGVLVAVICAVVGTWVVIRGMAFLGEALSHGMLPGVALATVLGVPPIAGAAVSATAMAGAIGILQRRGRLSFDTSIGLLFVSMLSLGVIVVSHSRTFATDATAMLFGDILAVDGPDLIVLAVALTVTLLLAAAFHRSFVAAAFDRRIAATLGLRPGLSQVVLVGLVALAVVSAYQAVGTLLVVGLLLAPAVAARPWAPRIAATMALAAILGALAVASGLILSWHAGTAAGASIAGAAVLIAAVSGILRAGIRALRARRADTSVDELSVMPSAPRDHAAAAAVPFSNDASRV